MSLTKLINRKTYYHYKDMPSWMLLCFLSLSSLAMWALSPMVTIPHDYSQIFNEYGMTPLGAALGILIVFVVVIPSIYCTALSARCSALLFQRHFQ